MAKPYFAYLVGNGKHFFIAVLMDMQANDQWTVYTAWGLEKVLSINSQKAYDGRTGRTGEPFSGQHNAEAYAKAIVNNKINDGYKQVVLLDGDVVDGQHPTWWACVERGLARYDGGKVAASAAKPRWSPRARKLDTLKEQMAAAAKVKIEEGKARIVVKEAETPPRRVIQPRFSFTPRKP